MGQFGPYLRTSHSRSRFIAPVMFSVGFTLSAVLAIVLLHRLAMAVEVEHVGERSREIVLGGVAVLLASSDAIRLLRREGCSLGLRRQTPRALGFRPIGPLLWGLDTGLPFTTVRTTSLPFVGLASVALGFGGAWTGAGYAGGFLLGVLGVSSYLPQQTSPAQVALHVTGRLSRFRDAVRIAACLLTFGLGAVLLGVGIR